MNDIAANHWPVRARGLCKNIPGPDGLLRVLSELDLQVASGEAVAILGASGSGKTTLLGLLAGLDEPTGGTVELLGQPLERLNQDQRARLRAGRVGFVFQNFQLLPALTALENVLLPLELANHPKALAKARAALDAVGLMPRANHRPAALSGGEQQRVALARAFAPCPRVLFADEPTGNLDRHTGEQVVERLFEQQQAHGTTLVLVTHDGILAHRCHRRLNLDQGRLGALVQLG
ncbi:MAG: ATP-binding cassette domain-containing protein [Pseudomonadota bacterium]